MSKNVNNDVSKDSPIGAGISLSYCLATGIETWFQKRSPWRNLGEHRQVGRSSTTSIGTALSVFSERVRSFHRTEFLTMCVRKKYLRRIN